jgi:hypothetical protein
MRYRIGRFLQLFGLILVPFAVAGNLAEVAGAPQSLDLKASLMLAGLGMVVFFIGWLVQGSSAAS